MTDQELWSTYGGYSDEQLAEFIAGGVPEEQRQGFQRLLRLRKRQHYLDLLEKRDPPTPLKRQFNPLASRPQSLESVETKPAVKAWWRAALAAIILLLAVVIYALYTLANVP